MRYVVILLSLLMLSIPFLQIASNIQAKDQHFESMNCIVIARGKGSVSVDYAHANKRGLPITYDKISFHFNPGTCFCIGRAGICRYRGEIRGSTSRGYFIGLIFPVKATGKTVIIGVAYRISVTKYS